MLRNQFRPEQPHRAVAYLRMSSDKQNPRSPDQQLDNIREELRRLGRPWEIVAVYRDDGVSGMTTRKRAGFKQMLAAIRTETMLADLILVDTFERFGRADEAGSMRQALQTRHGVLVLTADTHFADPTTPSGKVMTAFEAVRSTEDNRIKAHNVLRGKKDAVRQGRWPGGRPPFGYRLHNNLVERHGRMEIDHSVIVPDPESARVVFRAFELADRHGWGCTRVARALNDDSDVPSKYKPFSDQSVNDWFADPVYRGEYVWGKYCTGVVDEVRILERNPADEVLHAPNFCEPIVPPELWEAVQVLRRARSEQMRAARANAHAAVGKQIRARMPGVAVRYLLSGMVRCGCCGLAMIINTTAPYTTKDGRRRRYAAYRCPAAASGGCSNRAGIPEEWLRETVVELVRRRLFPTGADDRPGPLTADAVSGSEAFQELLALVEEEARRLDVDRDEFRPAWERDLVESEGRTLGWSKSLANPDLPQEVRNAIEGDFAQELARQRVLKAQIAAAKADRAQSCALPSPEEVAERLSRLADVLAGENPTRANLELSLHIDRIRCFSDGRVAVRTCKLGALAGALEISMASQSTAEVQLSPASAGRCRARLRVAGPDVDDPDVRAMVETASDLNRFACLPDEWFREDWFQKPVKVSWKAANAAAVAAKRQETGWSSAQLAEHFGMSETTIKEALAVARRNNEEPKD